MITVQSNLKQTEYENMSNEIWQYIILLRILSSLSFVYLYIFTSFILSIFEINLQLRIVDDYVMDWYAIIRVSRVLYNRK